MNHNYNGLSNAQLERLAMLAEEAGEVVQAVNKIIRHGYGAYNPTLPEKDQITNRLHLSMELGQLIGVMNHMIMSEDLLSGEIEHEAQAKISRAQKYMHSYQQPKSEYAYFIFLPTSKRP